MTALRRIATGGLCSLALVMAVPAVEAQPAPAFSADATESCVSRAAAGASGLTGGAVLECIGRASQACINTPGGDTTIGMMACLEGELKFWDGRLNAAYANRLAAARGMDAELSGIRATAVSVERSLREMQRTWMRFRDAACLFEQAQWLGGTGGGPATMACHMQETARQALKLEGWWAR